MKQASSHVLVDEQLRITFSGTKKQCEAAIKEGETLLTQAKYQARLAQLPADGVVKEEEVKKEEVDGHSEEDYLKAKKAFEEARERLVEVAEKVVVETMYYNMDIVDGVLSHDKDLTGIVAFNVSNVCLTLSVVDGVHEDDYTISDRQERVVELPVMFVEHEIVDDKVVVGDTHWSCLVNDNKYMVLVTTNGVTKYMAIFKESVQYASLRDTMQNFYPSMSRKDLHYCLTKVDEYYNGKVLPAAQAAMTEKQEHDKKVKARAERLITAYEEAKAWVDKELPGAKKMGEEMYKTSIELRLEGIMAEFDSNYDRVNKQVKEAIKEKQKVNVKSQPKPDAKEQVVKKEPQRGVTAKEDAMVWAELKALVATMSGEVFQTKEGKGSYKTLEKQAKTVYSFIMEDCRDLNFNPVEMVKEMQEVYAKLSTGKYNDFFTNEHTKSSSVAYKASIIKKEMFQGWNTSEVLTKKVEESYAKIADRLCLDVELVNLSGAHLTYSVLHYISKLV